MVEHKHITCIQPDLWNSGTETQTRAMQLVLFHGTLFQTVQSDGMDRILGGRGVGVRAISFIPNPRSSWLMETARGGLLDWLGSVRNACLIEGRIPQVLKEVE